jgi:capsular polysaccharide biosynthesis protein
MIFHYEVRSAAICGARKIKAALGWKILPYKISSSTLRHALKQKDEGIKIFGKKKPQKVPLTQTRTRHPYLPLVQTGSRLFQAPPIWLARVRDCHVFGPDIAVSTKKGTLLGDVSQSWEVRPEYHPILRTPQFRKVEQCSEPAALLAVTGGDTYFHWLFEVLPKVGILQRFLPERAGLKYVVNSLAAAFQRQTLELAGIRLADCIALDKNPSWRFRECWVPSYPGHIGVPSMEAIGFLRGLVRGHPKKVVGGKRIFLKRREPTRRLLEGIAIEKYLKKLGFRVLDPATISFSEQAKLFQNAEVIVSAHGAALANIVFCRRKTIIVEIFSGKYVNLCYQHLAGACGLFHYAVHPWSFRERLFSLGSQDMARNTSDIPAGVEDLTEVLLQTGVV